MNGARIRLLGQLVIKNKNDSCAAIVVCTQKAGIEY